MSESIEPKATVGRRTVAAVLYTALLASLVYVVFFYVSSPVAETITPGQLREVLEDFRRNQAARLARETAQMRKMLAQMKAIRDRWVAQSGIAEDTSAALADEERRWRSGAGAEVGGRRVHEVYDVARDVEQDMVTVYREFLAARMVGLRPALAYNEAYEMAVTPRPNRPDLDAAALYRDVTATRAGGGLSEFKAQIKRSTIETREMKENCRKLLAFTRKSTGQSGDGMSGEMSEDDVAMLGYRGPGLLPDEISYTHRADVGSFSALPGRRLTADGRTRDWMYVDSWYIIGPFAGDRRRGTLDTRFGPEANVNLDDVFVGKGNAKIGWEYTKTGHVGDQGQKQAFWVLQPKVVDTYAIYYAFTEVYSDVDRKVWIATGTDDYGKLWINDKLVWQSPKETKPYNATENIQLAELKKGQNKVLYRVENAGGLIRFSLLIRLGM